MGGTIAVGVLIQDGSVKYYLAWSGCIDTHQIINRTIEVHLNEYEKDCKSVDEFFKYELFEEEDSAIRYLVIDDNTVRYRYYGGNEEYTLTKKTLT